MKDIFEIDRISIMNEESINEAAEILSSNILNGITESSTTQEVVSIIRENTIKTSEDIKNALIHLDKGPSFAEHAFKIFSTLVRALINFVKTNAVIFGVSLVVPGVSVAAGISGLIAIIITAAEFIFGQYVNIAGSVNDRKQYANKLLIEFDKAIIAAKSRKPSPEKDKLIKELNDARTKVLNKIDAINKKHGNASNIVNNVQQDKTRVKEDNNNSNKNNKVNNESFTDVFEMDCAIVNK